MRSKRDKDSQRPTRIRKALEAIAAGMPIRGAARNFGLSESNLRYRIQGGGLAFKDKRQGSRLFTAAEERLLANYAIKMASLGAGLEVWQVSLKLYYTISRLNTSLQYRPTKNTCILIQF